MKQTNSVPDFVEEAAALFPDIREEYGALSALSRHLLASRKTEDFERAVLLQCGIAWQHYHAILLLLSHRFGVQALVLCRTLFELTVGALYLIKTPSSLPDFIDFGKLTLYEQALAANLSQPELIPLNAECQEIKNRLKKEKVKQWHRSSIKKMTEAVGLHALYETFYSDASAAAHSDASKTLSHGAQGWRQSLRMFNSDQQSDLVGYMSFQLIGLLFFEASKAVDLGHYDEAGRVRYLVLDRAKRAARPN